MHEFWWCAKTLTISNLVTDNFILQPIFGANKRIAVFCCRPRPYGRYKIIAFITADFGFDVDESMEWNHNHADTDVTIKWNQNHEGADKSMDWNQIHDNDEEISRESNALKRKCTLICIESSPRFHSSGAWNRSHHWFCWIDLYVFQKRCSNTSVRLPIRLFIISLYVMRCMSDMATKIGEDDLVDSFAPCCFDFAQDQGFWWF